MAEPPPQTRHSLHNVNVTDPTPLVHPATKTNLRGSVSLGTESHSTPVIADERVYVGTNNDEPRDPAHAGDRGVLMCLDKNDGRLLWQLVVPKREEEDPYLDWPKSGISSTVMVEGDRVYLVDNRGVVLCLDAQGLSNGNDGPLRDEGRYCASRAANGGQPQWCWDRWMRTFSGPSI